MFSSRGDVEGDVSRAGGTTRYCMSKKSCPIFYSKYAVRLLGHVGIALLSCRGKGLRSIDSIP